jgi:hypothetical protein
MPDLDFKIVSVEAVQRGIVPLLHFKVEIVNKSPDETIQSVILQAQIQIQSPQRSYNAAEKEKLGELFGKPEDWGQTLRNKLWTHSNGIVRSFTDKTEAILAVPCTFDLNVASSKYFYGLENGEVPLLFLFSGTVFYTATNDRLQIERISWAKEAEYRMPVAVWRDLMDRHYPNSAWIALERDLFDRLYHFKREHGFATWEQTISELLSHNGEHK